MYKRAKSRQSIIIITLFFSLVNGGFLSADPGVDNALGSITIESDKMECIRERNTCIASGHVFVSENNFTLKSDHLSVIFLKAPGGKQEVSHIYAKGNIRFKSGPTEEASAPYAFYDHVRQKLVMRACEGSKEPGSCSQTFYPTLQKEQNLVRAQEIIINFTKSANNRIELDTISAKGKVMLSTPENIAQGDFAIYTPATKLVTLKGHVVIDRHEGQISGSYAEVNLDTGISKMLNTSPGTKGSGERVQIFLKPLNVIKKQ